MYGLNPELDFLIAKNSAAALSAIKPFSSTYELMLVPSSNEAPRIAVIPLKTESA